MGFHEVQFPTNISYGSMGGPGFKTEIIEIDSGAEERISRWNNPRRRYDASYGIRKYDDLAAVLEFYIARKGAAYGFRFKDWMDFTSASNHRDALDEKDVQIGTGDGNTVAFQLIKKYTSGAITRTRNITKPVSGTTKIALDDVNQPSGWSVNTTNGVVTFSSAPGSNVKVQAGFEFDVPVRFGEEADTAFQISHDDFSSGSVPSIPIIEILGDGESSDEFYYGGANYKTMAANADLAIGDGRMQTIVATAASLELKMPDTTNLPKGGPYFFLKNGGANLVNLVTFADVYIASLAIGGSMTMLIGEDSASNKLWIAMGA